MRPWAPREDKFILDGHTPVAVHDLYAWGTWLENAGALRLVGHAVIDEHLHVSTVFLGLDHNFSREGPPLLFESIIFGGPHDLEMWRYSTWEQAERGHAAVVAWLLGGPKPP